MRLLVISDIHSNLQAVKRLLREIDDVDAVIVAGDVTNFGSVSQAVKILKALARVAKVYFVPGNCDPPELLELRGIGEAITNVHGTSANLDDLALAGFGGSNPTPFSTWVEFDEVTIYNRLSGLFAGGWVSVLITHAPPHGTKLDVTRGGLHVGSTAIRRIIEERRPLLHVAGHIHESRGVDELAGVVSVNPGPLAWGFYALVSLRPGSKTQISLEKLT